VLALFLVREHQGPSQPSFQYKVPTMQLTIVMSAYADE